MHVKVGDTVKVISGHDKGKIGEVAEILKHNSKIVVKDINLKTKHVKSRTEGESGQIIKVVSNQFFTFQIFSILCCSVFFGNEFYGVAAHIINEHIVTQLSSYLQVLTFLSFNFPDWSTHSQLECDALLQRKASNEQGRS